MNRRQIQNQQMILKVLGFYRGKCDGIWSKQTIKAKQEFERDPKFKPAYPNNGMPFDLQVTAKLPAGVYHDPRRQGMLAHDELTQDKITEYSAQLVVQHDNRKETISMPVAEKPKPVEPETKPDPEPEEEDGLEETPETEPKKVVPHSHHSNHQRKNRHKGNNR